MNKKKNDKFVVWGVRNVKKSHFDSKMFGC